MRHLYRKQIRLRLNPENCEGFTKTCKLASYSGDIPRKSLFLNTCVL